MLFMNIRKNILFSLTALTFICLLSFCSGSSGNSNREKDRNNHIPFFHSASASFDFNLPSLISTIRSAKEAIPGS